jgi:hypothetical protein
MEPCCFRRLCGFGVEKRMNRFLKIVTLLVYTGGAFMAGMLVAQVSTYALYVLIYSGAAFMMGLWFGQRWERSWTAGREAAGLPETAVQESHSKERPETERLGLHQ